MEEIVPGLGQLPPGYMFTPTDSQLIIHYLIPKIESRELPQIPIHDVNIYNHTPEELAERYRAASSEKKWYFLTPRERIFPNGDRPKRATRDVGYWKATQCKTQVYDDATGQMVGHRANLEFHDHRSKKTAWLMHEYTATGTNLPFGTKKLNEWVLCKIYKKEKNQTGGPVPNYTTNAVENVQKMATFEDFSSVQAYNHQNMLTSTASNDYQFTNGASSFSSMEPLHYTAVLAPTPEISNQDFQQNSYQDSETLLNHQNMYTSTGSNCYQFANGASSFSSMEPLDYDGGYTAQVFQLDLQISSNQSMVQVPNNHIPQNTFTNAAPAQHGGYTEDFAPTPVNLNNFYVQNQYQSMVVPPDSGQNEFSFDEFFGSNSIDDLNSFYEDFPV